MNAPRWLRAAGLRLIPVLVVLACAVAGSSSEAQEAAKPGLRRVQPPEDPLAPWPLEGVAPSAPAEAAAEARPQAPGDSTAGLAASPSPVVAPVDSSEIVEVVRLKQILVSGSDQVKLLGRMLQSGMTLAEAEKALGITEVDERTRTYAIDELSPDIQAEIETMPDSAWSRGRPWRGRTAFFQLLSREERGRGTVPALGENLDEQERNLLATTLREAEPPKPQPTGQDMNLTPAAVLEQVPAEYPPTATESGEVTLLVDVGRLGEVQNVRVESSTDRIFENAAIEAARQSKYRAADRSGFPEPGTVRLTYKFAAPQTPGADTGSSPEP